ncbi:MAG: magnesium transporter CorA family protein [Saprospiraceae bacterium]
MIRFLTKEEGQLVELEKPTNKCWINISPPFVQEELVKLADGLDIPLDFLLDSLDIDERSRYEREEDIKLIVVNTPVLNKSEIDNDALYITVPVGIVLTDEHIITITSYVNPVLQLFLEGKVKYFNPSDHSAFVLQLLEQNVYRFLTCLKKLNTKRNLVEKELYHSSRNQDLRSLLNIEKSLVYFLNSLSSNELLKMKMKRSDFLGIRDDESKTDLFEDIIIDNSQALEMANVYTNILNGTMEAYASIISNNLNVVIQGLTLITIILSVPTLIASLFGMNVPLPFDSDGNSFMFFYIIIFSIVVSLLLAWWFRKKRLF